MKRHAFLARVLCALVLVVGACLSTRCSAATKDEPEKDKPAQASSDLVEEALRQEISGNDVRRNELLHRALEQAPNYPPALWHTGHLRHKKRWRSFEQLADLSADDRKLTSYRQFRQGFAETAAAQLELAHWCAARKLVDQQRAHLTKVIELDPDHEEARRDLGYRWVDGDWHRVEEMIEAQRHARQILASLKKWQPTVVKIQSQLGHRNLRAREIALKRLLTIDDPEAIAVMEVVFGGGSEESALLLVKTLSEISHADASVALARQAVFSPFETVRYQASEKLKDRDYHSFVPQLLSAMGRPVYSQAHLYTEPGGRLVYRHAFLQEGEEQNKVAVVDTEYRNALLYGENPVEISLGRGLLAQARVYDAMMKARAREMAVIEHNLRVGELNARIGEVLSKVAGLHLISSPDNCWQWWNDYNEVYTIGKKSARIDHRSQSVLYEDAFKYEPSYRPEVTELPRQPARPIREPIDPTRASRTSIATRRLRGPISCLVPGTLIWTESGPVPIEKIEVGDRVVSQDPETGQVVCKPVLRTTSRTMGPILALETDKATIRCSGGHPFWISGKGWVKARQLEPGTRLHSVDGSLEVRSVAPSGRRQTHNLIVADFHTYFVGEAKILSHDITIHKPTNTLVPGLTAP